MSMGLLSSIACITILASAYASDFRPTAACSGVSYEGVYKDQVEAFLGIQFGQDTGGSNRFKPPKPYHYIHGATVDASKPGAACPQQTGAVLLPIYLGNYTDISEDCLRLNIHRPNGTQAHDALPVMIYIHGGGFRGASKDDPTSLPGALILNAANNGNPVIQVQINYRLGIFGFAQSRSLKKAGSENAALRDQRLALEWVHDHIANFGGNPNNVLIHGQSSGGLAVGLQTIAFGATKYQPFHKIIAQSQILEGGIAGNFTRDAMQNVAIASKCNASSIDSTSAIECLRELSMEDLLEAQVSTATEANMGDEWLPVVDGDFLPAAPSELIISGRFYNVTTMIGWCEDDTTFFIEPRLKSANETRAFFQTNLPAFTDTNLEKLLSLYPESDFHTTYFQNGSVKFHGEVGRAGRIYRDLLMTCQPIFFGQAMANAGNDVYYYVQNQTILTPILETNYSLYDEGVIHTSDFAYVFGNISHYDFPLDPKPKDYTLAKKQSSTWAAFSAFGKPSVEGQPTLQGWRKADFEDQNYGIYIIGGDFEGYAGSNGSPSARKALEVERLRERCEFLTSPELVEQQQF